MPRAKDWTNYYGKRFSRLLIESHFREKGRVYFRTRCDCGKTKTIVANSILRKTKATVSCGCYRIEHLKDVGLRSYRFGTKKNPTYKSYQAMLWRNNPKNKQDFKYYKNIGICERWKGSDGYTNFLLDMGDRPTGMTLDRLNNDKGYSPENCRWADRTTQARNRHKTLKTIWNGEARPLKEVCDEIGIRYLSVLASRQRKPEDIDEIVRRLYTKKLAKAESVL